MPTTPYRERGKVIPDRKPVSFRLPFLPLGPPPPEPQFITSRHKVGELFFLPTPREDGAKWTLFNTVTVLSGGTLSVIATWSS